MPKMWKRSFVPYLFDFLPFMWQCLKDVFGKLSGGFLFSSKSEAPYLLDVKAGCGPRRDLDR